MFYIILKAKFVIDLFDLFISDCIIIKGDVVSDRC